MINWLGFSFLAVCIGLVYLSAEKPAFVSWNGNPFKAWDSNGAFGIPIMFVAMGVGCACSMILS